MSTYESAALWSATPLALDEKEARLHRSFGAPAQSLSLLTQPVTADQLAQNITAAGGGDSSRAGTFAKLGLATTDASSGDPMQLRMQRASSGSRIIKTPLFVRHRRCRALPPQSPLCGG